MAGDFWDQRYSAAGFAYGLTANGFLVEHVGDFPAGGRILLPAEGEGRNALFLAKSGFQVDGFDQSAVGMQKAAKLAQDAGVPVSVQVADAMAFDYGTARYDGAALIFAHFPPMVRKFVHAAVLGALKPGGVLVLEAFRKEQLGRPSGGPKDSAMLFSEAMLREDFAACSRLHIGATETDLCEGPSHQGRGAVIRMVARK